MRCLKPKSHPIKYFLVLLLVGCSAGCDLRFGEAARPDKPENHSSNKSKLPISPYYQPGAKPRQRLRGVNIKLLEHREAKDGREVEADARVQLSMTVYDLSMQQVTSGTFYAYTYRMPKSLWLASQGMHEEEYRRVVLPPRDGLCHHVETNTQCTNAKTTAGESCIDEYPYSRYESQCSIDLYGGNAPELTGLQHDTAYVVDLKVHQTCKPVWFTMCGLGGIFSDGCDTYELWCQ